jgi:5-methylcytosine-specific restriction endonuclease McrA
MKSKRAQACDISKKVKDRVWERDGGRCIICGSRMAMPNSHYIRRSQGGLGIEENVVTMCQRCHFMYDQGIDREAIATYTAKYLRSKYPDWNPDKLVYKKWED